MRHLIWMALQNPGTESIFLKDMKPKKLNELIVMIILLIMLGKLIVLIRVGYHMIIVLKLPFIYF